MLSPIPGFESDSEFSSHEIERYSAHLILKEIGVSGYTKLHKKRVLVVGAGGLGCTCLSFLSAQGCKRLGIVDGDVISSSNLARQIFYTHDSVGQLKVDWARRRCVEINPHIDIETFSEFLDSSNVEGIFSKYDIVCDCTDNLTVRLIISDWCVLLGKPLVSAAATRWQGHLTVYNYAYTENVLKSPTACWNHTSGCFRCLNQTNNTDPLDCSQNCSEIGVIGGIVGILGSMQAIEALKIALEMKNGTCECTGLNIDNYKPKDCVPAGRMFYFDALRATSRVFKLAPRRISCEVCGRGGVAEKFQQMEAEKTEKQKISEFARKCLDSLSTCKIGTQMTKVPSIGVKELFYQLYVFNRECVLLDVRSLLEVAMCKLPIQVENTRFTCLCVPVEELSTKIDDLKSTCQSLPVYAICRRGIRSSEAVRQLQETYKLRNVYSVNGGLRAWKSEVDRSFPQY